MPTVAQLKKSLKAQGLDTTGTKSELEARLAEAPGAEAVAAAVHSDGTKRKGPESNGGGASAAGGAVGKKAKPPGPDGGGAAEVPADIVILKRRYGKSKEVQAVKPDGTPMFPDAKDPREYRCEINGKRAQWIKRAKLESLGHHEAADAYDQQMEAAIAAAAPEAV
eukprot:SAG22_NODE_36_length_27184_cov_65.870076_1_plen_166_part_00